MENTAQRATQTLSKPSDVYAFSMSAYEVFTSAGISFDDGQRNVQIFFSTPPWGVLSEDLIYRLVVREGDRPDRLESLSEDKASISDQHWQIIEAAWQQNAALRPTFTQIVKLWRNPAPEDSRSLEANPLQSMPSSNTASGHKFRTFSQVHPFIIDLDISLPSPLSFPATVRNTSPILTDAASMLSVPPAYLERPTAIPISSQSFSSSSTARMESPSRRPPTVALHMPMEDEGSLIHQNSLSSTTSTHEAFGDSENTSQTSPSFSHFSFPGGKMPSNMHDLG